MQRGPVHMAEIIPCFNYLFLTEVFFRECYWKIISYVKWGNIYLTKRRFHHFTVFIYSFLFCIAYIQRQIFWTFRGSATQYSQGSSEAAPGSVVQKIWVWSNIEGIFYLPGSFLNSFPTVPFVLQSSVFLFLKLQHTCIQEEFCLGSSNLNSVGPAHPTFF